jgi:beta-phosphoglucomutase-like phosphatase (HAD superfamily)
MSIRRMAEHVSAFLPFTAFDHIVAGDSVTHSKPHPEPYLIGAELLGVDAVDCVAIEDSTTGLASAVAAGAVAIGVPLHSPLEHGRGYTIWPTLEGRTITDISELLQSNRTDAA